MGSPISKVKEESKKSQKQDEDETEKTIQSMCALMESKLNEFKLALISSKGEDKSIPIKTVLEFKTYQSINASDKPTKNLEDAIDGMFEKNVKSIVKPLAMTALNTLLGSTAGGSKTIKSFEILVSYNTIIRIDYMMYSFTLKSSGFSDRTKNCMCMLSMLSTIDLPHISLDILSYTIGKAANQSEEYAKMIEKESEKFEKISIGDSTDLRKKYEPIFSSYFGDIFSSKYLEYVAETEGNLLNDRVKEDGAVVERKTLNKKEKEKACSMAYADTKKYVKDLRTNKGTIGSQLQSKLIAEMQQIYTELQPLYKIMKTQESKL